MFAHKLSMYLKIDGVLAFKHKIENEVVQYWTAFKNEMVAYFGPYPRLV